MFRSKDVNFCLIYNCKFSLPLLSKNHDSVKRLKFFYCYVYICLPFTFFSMIQLSDFLIIRFITEL